MYVCDRKISLKDTDATGVIYFGSLFDHALEAFESFLHGKNQKLSSFFAEGFFFPVVHASADYFHPIHAGDLVNIELTCSKIGHKSFSIQTMFFIEKQLVGSVVLSHAFVSKQEGKSIPLPDWMIQILNSV